MIPIKDSRRLARVPLVTLALLLANAVVYLVSIGHGGSLIGGPTSETLIRWGAIPYEFSHYGQHCDIGLNGLGQSVLCTGQQAVRGTVAAQPATWLTAFSALFLHANILTLLVNLVFLAVFGTSLEDQLGRARFLGLYALGGLAALALAVAVTPGSASPLIGASGAVATVLGAYVVINPRGKSSPSSR